MDFDDWQITRVFFRSLEEFWGPQLTVLLSITQQSSLDSFRVSGTQARQELTSLYKI